MLNEYTFNSLLIEIFWLENRSFGEVIDLLKDDFQFSFNRDLLIADLITYDEETGKWTFQFSFNRDLLIGREQVVPFTDRGIPK